MLHSILLTTYVVKIFCVIAFAKTGDLPEKLLPR